MVFVDGVWASTGQCEVHVLRFKEHSSLVKLFIPFISLYMLPVRVLSITKAIKQALNILSKVVQSNKRYS